MTPRPSLTRAVRFRFHYGQVVYVRSNQDQYGRVVREPLGQREFYMVRFWDADHADTWECEYDVSELRPLTKRERGQ